MWRKVSMSHSRWKRKVKLGVGRVYDGLVHSVFLRVLTVWAGSIVPCCGIFANCGWFVSWDELGQMKSVFLRILFKCLIAIVECCDAQIVLAFLHTPPQGRTCLLCTYIKEQKMRGMT